MGESDRRVLLSSKTRLPKSKAQTDHQRKKSRKERKEHRFVLESAVFEELMIVQGKSWRPLKKSGKVHSLVLVPSQGELLVMGRRPKQHEFEALLGYRVR